MEKKIMELAVGSFDKVETFIKNQPGVISDVEVFPEGSIFEGCEGTSYFIGGIELVNEMIGISHRRRQLIVEGKVIADWSYDF